jgi:hypothetical protein
MRRRASEWRSKGFFPVLNEREQAPAANLAASVMYRALQLKQSHPLPETAILPGTFDFSLDREQQCPRIEEYDTFERKNPLWGMPFGLPGLSSASSLRCVAGSKVARRSRAAALAGAGRQGRWATGKLF